MKQRRCLSAILFCVGIAAALPATAAETEDYDTLKSNYEALQEDYEELEEKIENEK